MSDQPTSSDATAAPSPAQHQSLPPRRRHRPRPRPRHPHQHNARRHEHPSAAAAAEESAVSSAASSHRRARARPVAGSAFRGRRRALGPKRRRESESAIAANGLDAPESDTEILQLREQVRRLQQQLAAAAAQNTDPLAAFAGAVDAAPFYAVSSPTFYPAVNSGPSSSDSSGDEDEDDEASEEEDDDGESGDEDAAVGGLAGAFRAMMKFGRSPPSQSHSHSDSSDDDDYDDNDDAEVFDDSDGSQPRSDRSRARQRSRDPQSESEHIQAESEHGDADADGDGSDAANHRSRRVDSDEGSTFSSSSSSSSAYAVSRSSSASSHRRSHSGSRASSSIGSMSSLSSTADRFPYERNLFALQPHYFFLERLYACQDAVTYKAVQRIAQRVVVIKISDEYDPREGCDPKEVRMLTTAQGHPNIVRLLGWHPLVATECAAMVTLFAENDPIEVTLFPSVRKQQSYARQLLEALRFLHAHRIVYRDVKPSNVLWHDESECVTVIDFDIATFYSAENKHRAAVGTDGYFAPEILRLQREKRSRRAERRGQAHDEQDEDEDEDEDEKGQESEPPNEGEETVTSQQVAGDADVVGDRVDETEAADSRCAVAGANSDVSVDASAADKSTVDGYDFSVDVYSSGVVLAQLLWQVTEDQVADLDRADCKGPAFRRRARAQLKATGVDRFAAQLSLDAGLLHCDLIARMLEPNPRARLTVEAALAHPWFRIEYPSRADEAQKMSGADERQMRSIVDDGGSGSSEAGNRGDGGSLCGSLQHSRLEQ